MDLAERRASMFKALGDKTRVQIFDFLRERCCPVAVEENGDVHPVNGPSVGEVCCHVTGRERINSTVSFHIRELKDAGLISVEKRGKYMICNVNRSAISELAAYLGEGLAPKQEDRC